MFSISNIPSTTAVLSTYTTVAASAVLIRTIFNEVRSMTNQIIPIEIQEKLLSKLGILLGNHSSQMCVVIDEKNGQYSFNEVFEASELYLQKRITSSVKKLKLSKASGEKSLSVTIGKGETIVDIFEGIQFMWQLICSETNKTSTDYEGGFSSETVERRSFELSFDEKYMEKALNCYLPQVLERAKAMKVANKVVHLQALGNYSSGSVVLNHPSTFDTLAIDPELKKALIDDLDMFLERRDYYRRVGKAWKRGYLLYGPPGTGKSSLIAAMANYLKFDIYDVELASLRNNADLRTQLGCTTNRSIMVIEDIDCNIDLPNRASGEYNQNENQLTLSGLLNFIDGLWSSCGDERIIVFTTNHKDRLDPALLRPGRMDMHIHMSYCTPDGFKVLSSNYLGIKSHYKFSEIEKLLSEVEATPAEIAEQLMRNKETDAAISGLVKFLNDKKTEQQAQVIVSPEGSEVNNNNKGNVKEELKQSVEHKVKKNKRRSRRVANRR